MHPFHDLFSYFLHLCPETFGDGFAQDRKSLGLSGGCTYVRETQKVKGFRLSLSSLRSVGWCKPPEFDETGLLVVQLQSKLAQPFLQLLLEKLCFILVLESHDPIIGISHNDHIATYPPSPTVYP